MVSTTFVRAWKREALVDYSKSILLTNSQHIETMELKQQCKQAAVEEAQRQKQAAAQKRTAEEVERLRKE